MKIVESSQRNGEEAARNPWYMKTNLQYIDKQLVHRVISKDDSLLQRRTPTYTHMHTNTDSHYGFCKNSKENICVLKVLPVIFLYFFPPAVIIFSPVKQIKTPRPNGGWGSGSDFPLSGSQMRRSYKQALCWKTWPAVCVCRWICVNFLVSGNSTARSGFNCTSFSNFRKSFSGQITIHNSIVLNKTIVFII